MDLDELKSAVDGYAAAAEKAAKQLGDDLKSLGARLEKVETRMARKVNPADGMATNTAAHDRELKALGLFTKAGDDAELKAAAMSSDIDPAGGYIVLPTVSNTILAALRDQSTMRRLARIVTLDRSDSWQEPNAGYGTDTGGAWVGETEARPETDAPDIGLLDIPLDEVYANIKVSQRLLDDSPYNIGAFVESAIGDKFGRLEGDGFLTSNGVKKPRGLLDYDTARTADFTRARNIFQTVPSLHSTTITPDSLRNLFWTVRAPYRTKATWLMSSATAAIVDTLKDGNGNYLWRNSQTDGAPPTLLGKPVEFDEGMPAAAAGTLPVAFGDFRRGYTIVDRPGLRMLQDPYTAKPHVLFYAYRRVGGAASDFHAVKFLEIAAS